MKCYSHNADGTHYSYFKAMHREPDALVVQTLEGDYDVHYASPEITVIVDGDYVDALEFGDILEGGKAVVTRDVYIDFYTEDGDNAIEFGLPTFYRVIREWVHRRVNTDKRLRLIGG